MESRCHTVRMMSRAFRARSCCCHWSHFSSRISLFTEVRGRGTCTARFFALFLKFRETTFSEIFLRLDAIQELALAELSISIQVHSSNDCNQESITGINATFDKESLQVASVDESKVAVIDVFVAGLCVEIVTRCQILFTHLALAAECKLFLD